MLNKNILEKQENNWIIDGVIKSLKLSENGNCYICVCASMICIQI